MRFRTAVLAALLLAGCARTAQVTRPEAEVATTLMLSTEEERELGRQLSEQVRKDQPPVDDAKVQQFVQRVGRHVLQSVPEDERRFEYEFVVLDTPDTVNAFALPGGYVFVNSGLLRAAETEAELASVLAHEIAHLTAGHVTRELAAQVGTQAVRDMVLGRNPGHVAQVGGTVATQGYLVAHSRDSEREADRLGLGYLVEAGYASEAMPAFFERLARLQGAQPGAVASFFASHPAPGARADDLEDLIRARGYKPGRNSIVGGLERVQAQVGGPTPIG